jgi:hypothetical protein
VLAFPDVVHLLAHEFARLGRGSFSGALVSTSSFHRLLLGHMEISVRGANRKLDAIPLRVAAIVLPAHDMRGTRIAMHEQSKISSKENLWPSWRAM